MKLEPKELVTLDGEKLPTDAWKAVATAITNTRFDSLQDILNDDRAEITKLTTSLQSIVDSIITMNKEEDISNFLFLALSLKMGKQIEKLMSRNNN